jgi:hypothetical protein
MAELNSHIRFPRYIQFRAPEKFPDAVAAAANKRLTTASEYMRQAVLAQLKADGIEGLSAA